MAEQGGGCRKIVMVGCFIMLGVLVVALIVTAVVFGVVWSQVRDEQVEQRELYRDLQPQAPAIDDQPLDVPTEFEPPRPAGRVVLDLQHTFFSVRPGPAGEPLRVDAEFDAQQYELTETLVEGDAGWVYEIEFRRTADSYVMSMLKELLGGTRARVEISLPPDVLYDLEVGILQGGAELDLGGLWLNDVELGFLQGGGEVSFSEPLRRPMNELDISFVQGGGEVKSIANAAPRSLSAEFSMGGGDLDLRGRWTRDTDITIEQSMGGVSVRLPDGVIIRGLGRYDTEQPTEGEQPTLRFSTSSSMGELDIVGP